MNMKRIQPGFLVGLLVSVGAASFFFFHLFFQSGRALPKLPWTTTPLLLFLATTLFLTAFNIYRRLDEQRKSQQKKVPAERKPIDPLFLARLLLLAKSTAHGGALLAGIYVGLALAYLIDLPHSSFIWNPIIDTFFALLVAVAGYVLERVLTIKDDGKAI